MSLDKNLEEIRKDFFSVDETHEQLKKTSKKLHQLVKPFLIKAIVQLIQALVYGWVMIFAFNRGGYSTLIIVAIVLIVFSIQDLRRS